MKWSNEKEKYACSMKIKLPYYMNIDKQDYEIKECEDFIIYCLKNKIHLQVNSNTELIDHNIDRKYINTDEYTNVYIVEAELTFNKPQHHLIEETIKQLEALNRSLTPIKY